MNNSIKEMHFFTGLCIENEYLCKKKIFLMGVKCFLMPWEKVTKPMTKPIFDNEGAGNLKN